MILQVAFLATGAIQVLAVPRSLTALVQVGAVKVVVT